MGWDSGDCPDDVKELCGGRFLEALRFVREAATRLNSRDFGDLIGRAVRMFRECPAVTKKSRMSFRHILVDEYQDFNPAKEACVARPAGGADANPWRSGDADQAIHTWRSANEDNIHCSMVVWARDAGLSVGRRVCGGIPDGSAGADGVAIGQRVSLATPSSMVARLRIVVRAFDGDRGSSRQE